MTLWRPIIFICGQLLLVMALLMGLVAAFSVLRGDPETGVFFRSALITLGIGLAMLAWGRTRHFHLVARQLYLLTTAAWLLMSLAGALPLFFSHFQLSFTDAVFEAVSGITTTGSTVLSGIETLAPSLLLWRSLLQWLGGLGVIGMAVSILPYLRIGGMRLFHTESSDWSEKSMPRIQTLARLLLVTYLAITLACTLAYATVGMGWFDAVNHAMTTVSTGGYATDDRSLGRFDSPVLWVASLFMLVGALPFTVIIGFARRPSLAILDNQQIRGLLLIVLSLTLVLALYLVWRLGMEPGAAVTQALFNLVSVITTTGFASTDYSLWGPFSVALFFFVTFIGGCSGSTSGGMKVFRFQLSALFLRQQVRKLIHPRGIYVALYNGRPLPDDIMLSAVAFSFLFFVCLAAATLLLALMGLDLVTSLTAAATALTNVGPGLGEIVGPAGNFASLPAPAKWLLCFAMLLGRLELLTIMVLFSRTFWRG
ncbi:MAG: potassium transporter TrkH [Haliea sp.]|mgnify:FL=1|nr:potassium transporter TrkH [Haliea sp.]|tara:strand:- start:120967 stop:122412 length:1446 start_codon:yes stop_codon:yes gene_type:complete